MTARDDFDPLAPQREASLNIERCENVEELAIAIARREAAGR